MCRAYCRMPLLHDLQVARLRPRKNRVACQHKIDDQPILIASMGNLARRQSCHETGQGGLVLSVKTIERGESQIQRHGAIERGDLSGMPGDKPR